MNTKTVKVVDYFNGWQSRSMTWAEAEEYLANRSYPRLTAQGIEPITAEWGFDDRFSEWAWFDKGQRIS